MKTENTEVEKTKKTTRKINIGVKTYPELKLKLSDEANSLKISLSEHCENILSTHSDILEELNVLKIELNLLKQSNTSLDIALSQINITSYNKKIQQLEEYNINLKKELETMKSNLQIYSDPRLADHFKKVKGLKDKIITDNGEMNITFNSPKDLLLAMIYSVKI